MAGTTDLHASKMASPPQSGEIRKLTTYLYQRCPKMDHHNLAVIRGDRKNKSLLAPDLKEYEELYEYIQRLWSPREVGRYGAIVEPLLQWAKVATLREDRQVVSCLAGKISGVVYANGDVGVCEIHQPIGNLRKNTFPEIWWSDAAKALLESIAPKECHCTTEVFLWSSVVYQPPELVSIAALVAVGATFAFQVTLIPILGLIGAGIAAVLAQTSSMVILLLAYRAVTGAHLTALIPRLADLGVMVETARSIRRPR